MQTYLFKKPEVKKDIVYTPISVSKYIIKYLNPNGIILDPCKGGGAFYNNFSGEKRYCEITEGLDFLLYNDYVNWIIGNPPYSIFEQFLHKAFDISDNVSFLVPTNKIFQRQIIMNMINNYGGIKSILIFGNGQLIDFPFGFSVGNFHFQKNYSGETQIKLGMSDIFGYV